MSPNAVYINNLCSIALSLSYVLSGIGDIGQIYKHEIKHNTG